MNFEHMPELAHPLGLPGGLGCISWCSVSAWIAFFRYKGWLGND
ncbi:MAG: hypothetical protein U5O39_11570 [Gammaproteobacteria bacterium]|nr:hypothetical protein [Gammaproteobacteria bacterium]